METINSQGTFEEFLFIHEPNSASDVVTVLLSVKAPTGTLKFRIHRVGKG